MDTTQTPDQYIAKFPEATQKVLQNLRKIIQSELPKADTVESISYGIIAFHVKGKRVVYMGGFTKHVSLFPVPVATGPTADLIEKYQAGKGTLQFKLSEPLPEEFIKEIVRLRLKASEHETYGARK